jgi:hypothetical protein
MSVGISNKFVVARPLTAKPISDVKQITDIASLGAGAVWIPNKRPLAKIPRENYWMGGQ